jgi:cytochrome c oxidase subunit 1
VVAHFHYVLIGGLLFTIFAGIYYWYPKAFGKIPDHKLGLWHFWLFTIALPHDLFAAALGIPRYARAACYTYQADRGWDTMNLISTIGVIFQAAGILFFVWNLIYSYIWGNPVTIHGTPGLSSGQPPRLRRNSMLPNSPK